jgi:hypothetical protein
VRIRDLAQLLSEDLEDYRPSLCKLADKTDRIGEGVGDAMKLATHTREAIINMYEQLYLKLGEPGEGKDNFDEILQAYENVQEVVDDFFEFWERQLIDEVHNINAICNVLEIWENKIREAILGFKDTRQDMYGELALIM